MGHCESTMTNTNSAAEDKLCARTDALVAKINAYGAEFSVTASFQSPGVIIVKQGAVRDFSIKYTAGRWSFFSNTMISASVANVVFRAIQSRKLAVNLV